MPIITPISYNTGFTIPGTITVGSLSVGTTDQDYGVVGQVNGLTYYSTPDQTNKYVIAHPDPSGGHNGQPGNVPAKVGFWSCANNDSAFLQLTNNLFNQGFSGASQASAWLTTNGYWNNYVASSSGNYTLLNAYSPANTNGSITFPDASGPSNNPNLVGLNPGNGIYINKFDLSGNDTSSILDLLIGRNGTLTLTQGSNSVTYSFTNTAFNYTSGAPYNNQYWWDNFHNAGQSPLNTITVTSPASSNFNYVDPITINVS